MFDSVELKMPVPCPKCNNSLNDFQTKDLGSYLDIYKEGNTRRKIVQLRRTKKNERDKNGFPMLIPTGVCYYQAHPKNVAFCAYDYCEKCYKLVYQDFKFDKKGKLKRDRKAKIDSL